MPGHPQPIIVQSRWKLAVRFAVLVALTAAAAFSSMLAGAMKEEIWGLLTLTFLAPIALGAFAASLAAAYALVHPASLRLGETGLTYSAYWYERVYRWSDIAEFFVSAPNRLRSVACRFAEGQPRRFTSFGHGWELEPEEVVQRLNEAKANRG